jgi:hypothetical protein
LCFGVFPLGLAGGPEGVAAGPPDDFARSEDALERLRGGGPPLLVRMYPVWEGMLSTARVLGQVGQLVLAPVPWDLGPLLPRPRR